MFASLYTLQDLGLCMCINFGAIKEVLGCQFQSHLPNHYFSNHLCYNRLSPLLLSITILMGIREEMR